MDEIRVFVVDDHPIFRQGVIDTLTFTDDIIVIGEADNGKDALPLIEELLPDVSILDVNLPGMNGLQLTRKILSKNIPTHVILLTAYDDYEQVIHAIRSGASAYRTKNIKPEELVETVKAVAAGRYFLDTEAMNKSELDLWLQSYTQGFAQTRIESGELFNPLSNREMDVLSHLTDGKSNKEIAANLGISHQTVKNHVTSILRKLNVNDRTQAVVYALRHGWFRLHDQ